MKFRKAALLSLLSALVFLSGLPVWAAHRATHLGHPVTRFATPLEKPGDLRARFRDPKLTPDIASVLRQWGWKGSLDDLHFAAQNARITELQLPIGYTMPFMSTRKDGRATLLREVIWSGPEPVPAYAFSFSSNGRRYRCVTPKACSNFFLEDEGADAPKLQLVKLAPREAGACEPFEMKLQVRNTGRVPLTQVKITDTLPAGLKTPDGRSQFEVDAGTLKPGAGVEFRFPVVASATGTFTNRARATSAEGATADAASVTTVRASALELICTTPEQVIAGRPIRVCLTLRNIGQVAEPNATITLPVPAESQVAEATAGGAITGTAVTWNVASLAPGDRREVCAVFTPTGTNTLVFQPSVQGACAAAESQCATRILGVTAILLEVVDLADPIQVGETATYVITVMNQGFARGDNIRLVCTLPPSQEFVSSSGSTRAVVEGSRVTMEVLPSLESKVVATWQVVAKALRPDDARFSVELHSDQFARPIRENEATQQY